MKKLNYRRWLLVILFITFFIMSIFIGVSKEMTIERLLSGDKRAWLILTESRWPRTMAIVLSASALSISGLIMQAISRNKYVSPSTSGTTDAAMLGILLSYLVLGSSSTLGRFIFAFIFAFISSFFFMKFISRLKHRDVIYIPLMGIMYGGILSAFATMIALSSDSMDLINQLTHGQFTTITKDNYYLLLIVIIPLVVAIFYANKFSLVSAGKDFAVNLGVNYNFVLTLGVLIVSLVSATTFITVGPLPFIGLIIPNIMSSLYGDNVGKTIIDVGLFGAVFVLINDIISRLIIYPSEISISLTMGIIGAFIFLILIFKGGRHAKV